MDRKAGVVVTGVSGRMGRMLVDVLADSADLRLAGAIERAGHDWVGRDLGHALGAAGAGITVGDDLAAALGDARVVIDFTAPAATLDFAAIAAEANAAHVIGTTGFSNDEIHALAPFAARSVQVRAGNMSLGVNLLVGLTRRVAAALGTEWDVEVVEAHHRRKVDAPSGTALMLGEAAADGRGVALGDVADRGRDGITGPREAGAIGFSAIRGGDIVGEHDVIFAGEGERLVLRHLATDRAIFARGALRAAAWSLEQAPGAYDMANVLGL